MRKVTIIVPVYNGELYLPVLLDSIIAQTCGDWSCICVDDGSTDHSLSVLRRYAGWDSRIVVVTQPNGGCGSARNAALQLVSTPYLAFADQDDAIHPRALEIALGAMESSGVDCLRVEISRFLESPEFQDMPLPMVSRTNRNGSMLFTGRHNSWPIFVWQYLYRTDAVKNIPFPPVSGGEDTAWMFELSWNRLSWGSIPNVLYANRECRTSQSRGISKHYVDCVFTAFDWMRRRSYRYDLDRKWFEGALRRMAIMFALSVVYRSPFKLFYALKKLRRCLFVGSSVPNFGNE